MLVRTGRMMMKMSESFTLIRYFIQANQPTSKHHPQSHHLSLRLVSLCISSSNMEPPLVIRYPGMIFLCGYYIASCRLNDFCEAFTTSVLLLSVVVLPLLTLMDAQVEYFKPRCFSVEHIQRWLCTRNDSSLHVAEGFRKKSLWWFYIYLFLN